VLYRAGRSEGKHGQVDVTRDAHLEPRPALRRLLELVAQGIELGLGRQRSRGNPEVQRRAVQPVAGPRRETRCLVVIRPVSRLGEPEAGMIAETVDHADHPVPAFAGLAVGQVIQIGSEPVCRQPMASAAEGAGTLPTRCARRSPTAPSQIPAVHDLAFSGVTS
jgi:hypothetical protein